MVKRLAIDPGDVHVGYAYDGDGGVSTGEWMPMECIDRLVYLFTRNLVDEVVVERFILYEMDIKKQAWSKLQTSQLIGGIKVVARMFQIPVVEQDATIKKPTRAQLRARKIKQVGADIHARDAELHLYYRRLRTAKEEENRKCQSAQS